MSVSQLLATATRCAFLLSAAMLAACSVDATVSVTGTTPAQIEHLYVTVLGVWLNTSVSAVPSAAGWVGQTLATPQTVDLATLNAGTLMSLISDVKVAAGTYQQIAIVLADSSQALTSSAQTAGLTSNAEVQYLDTSGDTVTLPLELASPTSELIIPTSLSLSAGSGALGGSSSGTTGTDASPSTTGTTTSSTTTTTTSATTSTNSTRSDSLVVNIEAVRNLLLFNFGNQVGALLDPLLTGYNVAQVGGISGSLDLSAVASGVLTGPQGIVVTAETLSSDGSRYVVVKSAALQSDATFTLYPLPVADSGTTNYDLVIHGPGVQTVVITGVPVTDGAIDSLTSVQPDPITLLSATSYTVNTLAGATVVGAGAQVGFYQTVSGTTVPHLIEYALLDPFSGGFTSNISLSAGAVNSGAYDGAKDVALGAGTPAEGDGVYRLGTSSPYWASSSLITTVSAPASTENTLQAISTPLLQVPAGASGGTLTGTVSFAAAGLFNNGFLLLSRGGVIVDAVNLTSALAGATGAAVPFTDSGVPVGIPTAIYDVSVRLWNSSNPQGSLTRAALSAPVDMSAGSVSGVSLSVQ